MDLNHPFSAGKIIIEESQGSQLILEKMVFTYRSPHGISLDKLNSEEKFDKVLATMAVDSLISSPSTLTLQLLPGAKQGGDSVVHTAKVVGR
jgi:hypothetical protein